MRRLSKSITLVGTTALTCAVSLTAHAHDDTTFTPATSFEAQELDRRMPLNADVYHAFLDAKLDSLAALADATRTKVAAIPSDEVLTGMERRVAKMRLARAGKVTAIVDAIPDSGTYAPTAAQRAQISAIRADLAAIVAKVTALLANTPAPVAKTPTPTTRVEKSDRVPSTSWWWRKGGCAVRHDWDGWRDRDRDGR